MEKEWSRSKDCMHACVRARVTCEHSEIRFLCISFLNYKVEKICMKVRMSHEKSNLHTANSQASSRVRLSADTDVL